MSVDLTKSSEALRIWGQGEGDDLGVCIREFVLRQLQCSCQTTGHPWGIYYSSRSLLRCSISICISWTWYQGGEPFDHTAYGVFSLSVCLTLRWQHLKSIRTREENLDDLKRRRKATAVKADSAEKKLAKMSPEHKNLAMQMDTLNQLRDQIRSMDSEIMTEEAAIGDFKRAASRGFMGLKFGGLLECCEKGTVCCLSFALQKWGC